jgi:hypothetical protein
MNRTAIALAALILLAGCTTSTETTHITVGAYPAAELPFGDFASATYYEGTSLQHPGHYTAFDQLVQWSQETGNALAVGPPSQWGFCLDAIAGQPEKPGCQPGATAYWSLSVNGVEASSGMDSQRLAPGDSVTWTLVPLPSPDASKPALSLTLEPQGPTRNESVTVSGRVSVAAQLSFRLVHGNNTVDLSGLQADGAFTVQVPLQPGNATFEATADDGTDTARAMMSLVRHAMGSVKVDYRNLPGHTARTDEVWFDPDSRPSLPYYEGQPVAHPAFANVHDLMVAWTAQTGVVVTYKPHASFGQQVMKIDDVGDPTMNTSLFWCYRYNGDLASMGITGQEFKHGDAVAWSLGTC